MAVIQGWRGHYEISVKPSGPLFNGLAGVALERWQDAVGEELANMAQSEIRRRALLMRRSARPTSVKVEGKRVRFAASHPGRVNTGAAARAVRVYKTPERNWKVAGESREGEVWWPWLEGTSKRNDTTRFKGYHMFRIVKNIVQRRARKTGEDLLQARYLELMGGAP